MSDSKNPGEVCPVCHEKKLILTEREDEIPYFGKVFIFSMTCTNCKFHKADLESIDEKEPTKQSLEVSGEEDMKIRVVKSSQATVKIPHITTIEPGIDSIGYVSNIEGILNRVKRQVEGVRDTTDDDALKKKAKNMIKKINRVIWGDETVKITVEDPSGNSAIISDKVLVDKLKVKK